MADKEMRQHEKMLDFNMLQQKVIHAGLCVRCGLCMGICPLGSIGKDGKMFPKLQGKCTGCGLCVRCCPGGDVNLNQISHKLFSRPHELLNYRGYVEKTFVVYPKDETIRNAGASGGVMTGLLVYLLKKGEIDGAIVVGMDDKVPWQTRSMLATSREEIIAAAQSKYCLTPSLEVLQQLRRLKGRYAVTALPCQVHGLRKLQQVAPEIFKKIRYIFGIYCHSNLKPAACKDVLWASGVPKKDVARFNFRGGAWPGGFHVVKKDGTEQRLHKLNNTTVLNLLFRIYGGQRCSLCVDGLAEFADLSFGDFWAHDYAGKLGQCQRCTTVLQRTEKGKKMLEKALADDFISLQELPLDRLSKRTRNMATNKKKQALACIFRLQKKGIAVPDYHFTVPSPDARAKQGEFLYHSFRILRGQRIRRLLLKLLFSPVGRLLDRVNLKRKQVFNHFYDN